MTKEYYCINYKKSSRRKNICIERGIVITGRKALVLELSSDMIDLLNSEEFIAVKSLYVNCTIRGAKIMVIYTWLSYMLLK